MNSQPADQGRRDPDVPDPRQFDAYKELDHSQQAVIDQLAASLTRQSRSSRKRLYTSRVLRMGALTMATGVPIAIAAAAPNWVGALLGGSAALLEGSIQVFRHEERALIEIRRYRSELGEYDDFLATQSDYRHYPKPYDLLVDRLSQIRHQAQRADLLILSRPSTDKSGEAAAH
jgi:hypothetical protein